MTAVKAAKGTGFSRSTLDKVTKVREIAADPEVDPEVREEAQRQHDALMDGTAKADPALAKVEATKRRKQRPPKLTTGLGPGQWIEPPPAAKPEPTLSQRLVDAISKGQKMAEIAIEVQDTDLDLNSDTITTVCAKPMARLWVMPRNGMRASPPVCGSPMRVPGSDGPTSIRDVGLEVDVNPACHCLSHPLQHASSASRSSFIAVNPSAGAGLGRRNTG